MAVKIQMYTRGWQPQWTCLWNAISGRADLQNALNGEAVTGHLGGRILATNNVSAKTLEREYTQECPPNWNIHVISNFSNKLSTKKCV